MSKKEEKAEKAAAKLLVTDIAELAKQIEDIGKQLDNPPVNLDRANYVTGTVSFGSLCLDVVTGGGLPPGKITDILGGEGSGKSTAVGHVMSSAIKENIPILYYDHEAGADGMYLGALGVKIRLASGKKNPYFNYFQPTTGESTYRHINRILDLLPDYTHSDEGRPLPVTIFIIDSIAAMMPESQQNDDESNQMAASARVHSYGLRMIKSKLGRKNCSLLVTNQQREKPGVSYGSPLYEVGGAALKYYPDLKIRFSAVGKDWLERNRQFKKMNVKTMKNKQFVPFLELEEKIALCFGKGFERGYDGLGYLEITNQIVKKGGWYTIATPTYEALNGQKVQHDALMQICCSNEFRSFARNQINSGDAFKLYFQSMDWEKMYSVDEEDSGVDLNKLMSEQEEVIDQEINETNLVSITP